jgi:curved DNA-binding protein CbpA
MVPELLVLALEFYRSPLRFRHLADPKAPLPPSFDRLVGDLGGTLGAGRIAATAADLGTTEQQLTEAVLFLVRQVMLAPGSDHYRVLGLSRAADPETIRRHYLILAGLLHPDRHPEAEAEHHRGLLARVNRAYEALRSPEVRQSYDATLPRQGRQTRWMGPATLAIAPDQAAPGAGKGPRRALTTHPRLVLGLVVVGLITGGAAIWVSDPHDLFGSAAQRPIGSGWPRHTIEAHPEAAKAPDSGPQATTRPRADQGTGPEANPAGTGAASRPALGPSPRADNKAHGQHEAAATSSTDSPSALDAGASPALLVPKPLEAAARLIHQPHGEATDGFLDGALPTPRSVPLLRLDDAQPAPPRHPTWFTGALD